MMRMKMKSMTWGRSLGISLGLSLAGLAGTASLAATATPPPATDAVNPNGDNSKINKRDDGMAEPTADQQRNNTSDVEITRKIRSALTDDKSLSTYAHNVKIITQNGQVVLKGPVRSATEKNAVEAAATRAAGQTAVKSELQVTPDK